MTNASALFIAAALALSGCVPVDGTGTSSSGSTASSTGGAADGGGDGSTQTRAGKACEDFATTYATAAQRCGGNYAAERAAFIRDLAGGDCNSVSIRNETELRSMCFPSFGTIPCADLMNSRFAPACAEQVVR